jgi:NADPH:quinone reductase-like Zn-dependent oxidoreductase
MSLSRPFSRYETHVTERTVIATPARSRISSSAARRVARLTCLDDLTSEFIMTSASQRSVRRWFITGAASGMGRALVECVLTDGDVVIASVRTPQALNDLQRRFPQTLDVEVLDVRDHAAIATAVEQITRRGGIDIVVNNAGYGAVGAAEELTGQRIDDQLQT